MYIYTDHDGGGSSSGRVGAAVVCVGSVAVTLQWEKRRLRTDYRGIKGQGPPDATHNTRRRDPGRRSPHSLSLSPPRFYCCCCSTWNNFHPLALVAVTHAHAPALQWHLQRKLLRSVISNRCVLFNLLLKCERNSAPAETITYITVTEG